MSEMETLGRFETTMDNMQKMLQWASAPFDERYDQAYINLAEEELRTVANAGQAVIAYCDFTSPFVQDIELHDEVDSEGGMQAIVKVPQIQEYLNFVGGKRVAIEFQGTPGNENRADKIVIEGELEAEIYLPSSQSDYESKQLQIVQKYDDEESWIKAGGDSLETSFETNVQQFEKIIELVSFDSFALANYPVVVEDGSFLVNAADENDRDNVAGELYAENVEGPNVNNRYSRGFEELFSNISGNITVEVEQDAPISIVRQSNDEALTLRYSVLPAQ